MADHLRKKNTNPKYNQSDLAAKQSVTPLLKQETLKDRQTDSDSPFHIYLSMLDCIKLRCISLLKEQNYCIRTCHRLFVQKLLFFEDKKNSMGIICRTIITPSFHYYGLSLVWIEQSDGSQLISNSCLSYLDNVELRT